MYNSKELNGFSKYQTKFKASNEQYSSLASQDEPQPKQPWPIQPNETKAQQKKLEH